MKQKDTNSKKDLPYKIIQTEVLHRQKEIGRLRKSNYIKTEPLTEYETRKLLHELEFQQIELEIQKEELHLALERAGNATKKNTLHHDFATIGYITLNPDGIICEINLSCDKMLADKRSGFTSRNFKLFITNNSRIIFNDFLDEVFATGIKQTCEIKLIIHENIKYVRLYGIAYENQQQCFITVDDITGHITADENLLNSELRYRRLFESAKDGILILDGETGFIVDVNPYLLKMLGYTHEELVGKELWEIGVFKNIADSKDAFTQLQNNGYIHFEDMPLESKTRKSINVEFVSNVYMEDKVKVIQCNIRDITQRKNVDASLKEKVAELHRMATVVSDSNDAVIMHDFDGKILAWNRGAKETYGYSEAEALEKNVRDIVAVSDRKAALTLIRKIKQGEIVKSFELRRVTKDGRILDVWLTTTLLRDEKGNPVAIATTERDITDRKGAELELIIAKEKAEESDRLKSAFLANMSHEIRTPLNSIIGFSDLLLDPYYKKEHHEKFVGLIKENGNSLLAIIINIMDLSKIEAGQVHIKKQMLSVNKLISSIHKDYLFNANKKGIELKLIQSNMQDIFIESDEIRIKKVLVNLVDNAIKFTKKGLIELGIKKAGNFIQFHVKDTGIGIQEKFHQQIFERFRQVETSSTRNFGGNGLGLSISKSLVELLGGSIWMNSAVNEGSTFYFTIPIKQ